jgi:Uma2 family endonuclease
MAVRVERYRFTVDDYYRMLASGILTEDSRVELIRGEVVAMSPIGSRHAACVDRLNRLLTVSDFGRAILRPEPGAFE